MTEVKHNTTLSAIEPYEFEKILTADLGLNILRNYQYVPIYCTVLYFSLIFSIQHIMKNRTPMELRKPLIIWNLVLALCNIAGSIRILPGFVHILRDFGFTFSVCNNKYILNIQPTVFWAFIFTATKFVELGDTLFIVLRKRKMLLLHWYHHIMTLIITWYTLSVPVAVTHWFGIMTNFIHSFMYFYYALSALQLKLPRWIAMMITLMQLSQMIIGSFACLWAIWKKMTGYSCEFPNHVILLTVFVCLSYLILFVRFYYISFCRKSVKMLKKN